MSAASAYLFQANRRDHAMPDEGVVAQDVGWTEEARAAALAVRAAKSQGKYREVKELPRHLTFPEKVHSLLVRGDLLGVPTVEKFLPFKVVKDLNHQDRTYKILTSKKTFAEAYAHPEGTHVVQTHGTLGEAERAARTAEGVQEPTGPKLAGTQTEQIVAEAEMTALGALTGSAQRRYELPTPIITPKPLRGKSADAWTAEAREAAQVVSSLKQTEGSRDAR